MLLNSTDVATGARILFQLIRDILFGIEKEREAFMRPFKRYT